MSEAVRVAAVQPPDPGGRDGHPQSIHRGLELVEQAAEAGARFICLPEYFGLFGLPYAEWPDRVRDGDDVLQACCESAQRHGAVILHPSLECADGHLFNTTRIIGRDGGIVGHYRKVHPTLSERKDVGVCAGDAFPVFSVDRLRFGVMTCYDAYFPEAARILALEGAQVIFWPSLQRSAADEVIYLQARSRALDNCVYVVRSSYGHPREASWTPGMIPGDACVADPDGRIVADLGHDEGILVVDLPVGAPRLRRRSHDGAEEDPRQFLFEDRRPDAYGRLCPTTGTKRVTGNRD